LASPFAIGIVSVPILNARQTTAVWTPTSDAPKDLLTALEGQRHDRFIDRARAGDIDIVFFGATDTEMWLWPDRGRSVWDQTFGSLKAATFGSQGTRFDSLLWRMQNGELDGYQAKVVVLQGFGHTGDQAIGDRQAEFVAGYTAIIAEIRARQPQAKILLSAAFPRGQLRRERGGKSRRRTPCVRQARRQHNRLLHRYRRQLFPTRRLSQQRDVDDVGSPECGNTRARIQGVGGKASALG
jgi:hypothetical protein